MLGRLRIGPKLLLAPALVLVLLIVSSSGAYLAMERQNQSLASIVQVRAARIKDATDLVAEAQAAHARSYRLLAWIGGSFAQPRVDALWADIGQRHGAIERRFARLLQGARVASTERRLLAQAATAHAAYVAALDEAVQFARADHTIGASAMGKAERAFDAAADKLAALSQLEQALSEQALQAAAAEFRITSVAMLVLAALSVALSVAVSRAVRRSLLEEVRGIGEVASGLASGNLTVSRREYGHDEISDTARALDASIAGLNATLKDILESARSLDLASRRIVAATVAGDACAVLQVDQMTQPDSRLVHEAAAAAHSLQVQALHLSLAVAGFKLDEGTACSSGKPKLRLAAQGGQLKEKHLEGEEAAE